MEASRSRRGAILLAAVSLAAVLVGFSGTWNGYFLTDDWQTLGYASQFRVGNAHHLLALGPGQLHWRPIPMAVWAAEYSLFGLDPVGYHLVKLGLHAACAFLLGILARRLTGSTGTATLAAALFALHPLGSAAGIWISATHENLLCLFFVGTLLALDRHVRGGRRLAPLVLGFICAALSKETGATLPALALAYAFLVAKPGEERRRALRATGVLVVLALLYAAVRVLAGALPGREATGNLQVRDVLWSLMVGPLRWLASPVGEEAHSSPGTAVFAFALVTGVVLARWAAGGARGRGVALLGLLFVPIAMAPVAPFFGSPSLGPEFWKALFAGHYLLVPTAGYALALAVLLGSSGARTPWLAALFVLALFGITLRRNHTPLVEAGEISARFAEGIREHVPTREPGRPVSVVYVGRPVWHRGIRIDPGQTLQVALEKRWPLPPYPTERGIPLAEIEFYRKALDEALPYKIFPDVYRSRGEALAAARERIARGEPLGDLVVLEWIESERALRPMEIPR